MQIMRDKAQLEALNRNNRAMSLERAEKRKSKVRSPMREKSLEPPINLLAQDTGAEALCKQYHVSVRKG